MPQSKIFDVPYNVDNGRFIDSSKIRKSERIRLLEATEIPYGMKRYIYSMSAPLQKESGR